MGKVYLIVSLLLITYASYTQTAFPKGINDSLIAYYPFNGNANDESGNGNNGTVNKASLTDDRFGNVNSAFSFDGTDSYVKVNSINPIQNKTFTKFSFSVWIKSIASTSNDQKIIEPIDEQLFISFYNNELDFRIGSHDIKAKNIEYNKWYHVIGTYDGAKMALYVNGILSPSSSAPSSIKFTPPIIFGKDHDGRYEQYFKGSIDDIRIYNKVLTKSEIQALYYEGGWEGDLSNGLVAYFPFNGNANDESGNSYNGTISGATLTTDRFGNSDKAFMFDGVNDIIKSNISSTFTEMTISLWVNSGAPPTNEHKDHGVILLNSILGMGWGYIEDFYYYRPDDKVPILICSNNYDQNCLYKVTVNKWHHIVLSYTKSGVKMYVDNIKMLENSEKVSMTSGPLEIGKGNYPAVTYMNGKIDDIRIYSRELSESEIQDLYHEGGWTGNVQDNVIGYWKLDETTGNIANDASGNNHTGTADAAATIVDGLYGKARLVPKEKNKKGVEIANSDLLNMIGNQPITLEAFVKLSNYENNGISFIQKEGNYGLGVGSYSSSGYLQLFLWPNTSSPFILQSDSQLPLNQWVHVAGTWDGYVAKLYVNHQLIKQQSYSTPIKGNSLKPVWLGYTGMDITPTTETIIDEARISAEALEPNEFLQFPATSNGLVAYFPFNGNANDESGNRNNGTINGAIQTADRFGIPNKAYSFNGADNYIEVPHNQILSPDQFSIQVWVKNNGSSEQYKHIVSKYYRDSNKMEGFVFQWRNDISSYLFSVSNGPIEDHHIAYNCPSYSEWNHFVMTYDGNEEKLYANGILVGTLPFKLINSDKPLELGRDYRGMHYFNGSIDDIRMYNRVLTDSEIQTLYHEGGWGPNYSSIRGTIKDVMLDINNGNIENQNLIADIKIYKKNTLYKTAESDANGNFDITVEQGIYRVEIIKSFLESGNKDIYTSKLIYDNVAQGVNLGQIYLPFTLTGQVYRKISELENLEVQADLWLGMYNDKINIEGYKSSGMRNNLYLSNTIGADYEKNINSLLKLLIAQNAIKEYYNDEAIMSVESLKSMFYLGKTLIALVSTGIKVDKLLNSTTLSKLFANTIKLGIKGIKYTASIACSKIDPPTGPLLESKYNSLFTKLEALPTFGSAIIDEVIKAIIYPYGSELLLEDLYIPKLSQSSFNYANNSFFTKKGSEQIANIFSTINNNIIENHTKTKNVKIIADVFREASGIFSVSSKITTAFAGLSAISGAGAPLASGLITFSAILNGLSVGTAATALFINGDYFVIIPNNLYATTQRVYSNSFQESPLIKEMKRDISISNQDPYFYIQKLNTDLSNYKDTLLTVIGYINIGQRTVAFEKINSLIKMDSIITETTDLSLLPIMSIASQANKTISNFDTLYFNTSSKVGISIFNRQSLYSSILAYFEDSNNSAFRDSVNFQAQNVINSNEKMSAALSQLTTTISNIPKPAIISTLKTISPSEVDKGSNFNIFVKFKNYGNIKSDSLYVKLELSEGFRAWKDSLFVGSLNAGAEDSLLFTVSSPNIDTSCIFNILYFSKNSTYHPTSGVVKTKKSTGMQIKSSRPIVYNLNQNYPNPFNPVTKISYAIPKNVRVKITVYDLLGNEIKTLVNEDKSAGYYIVQFEGSNLPSGVYFYRLEAGEYTATKKLILMK